MAYPVPCIGPRSALNGAFLAGSVHAQFYMSAADHPQTDGQTDRVNRVLVDLLSYAQSFYNWSDYLSMA
ncbi:reverse transcriptase [Phytophthora megakarya]|uniref:Reverse transcriptase n=1 Tax=Phytophthora megakarya TaxID=4795 RepID=A0A225VFZ6_9STRA|nr:reverse transcriptase [Phytophthora megakarya]